jgi:hypothetical protein
MARMQTLGLADSTPRSEGRLKSLFWPSIQNAWDVDYLGQQGFWICVVVGAMSLVVALIHGQWITGLLVALFFFLSAIGVREKSVTAAAMVFVAYTLDFVVSIIMLMPGNPLIRAIFCLLLFSNLRATWIASRWRQEEDSDGAEQPMRFNDTWRDKLVDQLPPLVWPKLRIPYYVLAAVYLLLSIAGTGMLLARGRAISHQKTRLTQVLKVAPPN